MRALFTRAERRVLREATYEADFAARSEANKVWDHIIAYIATEAQDSPPFEYLTKHAQTKGFAISRFDVPQLPGDLGVILAPPHGNTHGRLAQSQRNQSVIILYGVLQHPFHTEHLEQRIKGPSYRKTFVHEYVHYLDERRNPVLRKSADAAAKSGSRAGYLRTPEEFNAWFQGTSQEIEDAVDREEQHIHDMGKRAPRFRDFAETLLGHMHKRFETFHDFLVWTETLSFETPDLVSHLKGTKWERKWLKRMHTLYRALKPRVMAMETKP